ncbi:MAG: intracellular multiplication protein IcmV [Pseudomonadota bacterium]|jgi:intracellular multiplication protein IcmV
MGFWRGTGKVMGQIVDVRVDKWVGVETIKENTSALLAWVKTVFRVQEAHREETFEAAMARLQLTDTMVEERRRQYSILVYIFLAFSFIIFAYGIYLAYQHSWGGVSLSMALTVYSLSQAFRYDFWVYQFTQRRLGCSVKEWWSS